MDYKPIALKNYYNTTPAELMKNDMNFPTGPQIFGGIPFLIGNKNTTKTTPSFIKLTPENKQITINIKEKVQTIIFAHYLLNSEFSKNGTLGIEAAKYQFKNSNKTINQSIRERYEIQVPNAAFYLGGPFLAWNQHPHQILPKRHSGAWSNAGHRQTEAATVNGGDLSEEKAAPTVRINGRLTTIDSDYCLWVWKNPEPQKIIESISFIPTNLEILIGGITLGYVDEIPFTRTGKLPLIIETNDENNPENNKDFDVEVDRGMATYTHRLPGESDKQFLKAKTFGWGQEFNKNPNPSYTEISAMTSATINLKSDEKIVDSFKWKDLQKTKTLKTAKSNIKLIDSGKNWVKVKIIDADTKKPVPCRIHFRSPEGIPYQPHGYHNQVNSNLGTKHKDVGGDCRLGQITYAYINGQCEGWLPRGKVIIDIARGFEYEPIRKIETIAPGQQELQLEIKRWINMNDNGWFSGDSHVHFLSAQGSHLESQSEDLNVVNLLQSQWGSLFTNTEDFTGEPLISKDGKNIVYVGQENRQPFLGHMILWGIKTPIMPWCSDGVNEAEMGGTMETNMSWWADQCHSQKGHVIIPHFPGPNGEPATLVSTNRVDGVEMTRQGERTHKEYYRYLNCGYKLPLIGGTDKMSSDVPVGLYRTYTHIPKNEEFTYDSWCKNVALGRTFLSGGPIINLTVENSMIGDELKMSSPGTIEIEAWTESIFPVFSLDIIKNGQVVDSIQNKNGTRRLSIKTKIAIDENSWIAARCGGPTFYDSTAHYDGWERGIFAHTSPVYIACKSDKWSMFNEKTIEYMLTLVDGSLAYINNKAAVHTHDRITHHHGEADHNAFLQRPFIEAKTNLLKRLETKT